MSNYATRLELGDRNWSGRVIPYIASHLQPEPDDSRATAWIATAHVPGFCVPGHDDQPDDYPAGEWLRLSVDSVHQGQAATVLLDSDAARALAHDLLAWADLPKVAPK